VIDLFFAVNVALTMGVWVTANHQRYFTQVAAGRGAEFWLYAGVLLGGIVLLWRVVRRYSPPGWLLVCVEVAILAHLAGGWLHFGGDRLYGHIFAGIRYDKFVHVLCALVLALALDDAVQKSRFPDQLLTRVLVALAALGLSSGVEIYEFIVTQTMPLMSPARFEDSLRDLVADLVGVFVFLFARTVFDRSWKATVNPSPPS
jgi:hypothetical protein